MRDSTFRGRLARPRISDASTTLHLRGCTFEGVASAIAGTRVDLEDCRFVHCEAPAIATAFGRVVNCRFDRCAVGSHSLLSVHDGLVGGTAVHGTLVEGSASILDLGPGVQVVHCSIVGSRGGDHRAAILEGESGVTLRGCVLWDNDGAPVRSADRRNVRLVGCLVDGGWSGRGSGNFDDDPRFVDPAHGDLRPSHGSPLVDAADEASLALLGPLDPNGDPRLVDAPCVGAAGRALDIGAYEFDAAFADCDGNGIDDACDVAGGAPDIDGDRHPDRCLAGLLARRDAEWDDPDAWQGGAVPDASTEVVIGGRATVRAGTAVAASVTIASGGELRIEPGAHLATPRLVVRHGARLSGRGVVHGDVEVFGTIAPGPSIGVLQVQGTAWFHADAELELDHDPLEGMAHADRLDVRGLLRCAGTIRVATPPNAVRRQVDRLVATTQRERIGWFARALTGDVEVEGMLRHDAGRVHVGRVPRGRIVESLLLDDGADTSVPIGRALAIGADAGFVGWGEAGLGGAFVVDLGSAALRTTHVLAGPDACNPPILDADDRGGVLMPHRRSGAVPPFELVRYESEDGGWAGEPLEVRPEWLSVLGVALDEDRAVTLHHAEGDASLLVVRHQRTDDGWRIAHAFGVDQLLPPGTTGAAAARLALSGARAALAIPHLQPHDLPVASALILFDPDDPAAPARAVAVPAEAAHGAFGDAIAFVEDGLVVAATSVERADGDVGRLYHVDWASGAVTPIDTGRLLTGSWLGSSMACDGRTLVVGASAADPGRFDWSGAAYAVDARTLDFDRAVVVLPPDPFDRDFFARAVGVHGPDLIVTAPGDHAPDVLHRFRGAATGTHAACAADLDGDGVVGAEDLARVLACVGTRRRDADLDGDGVVDAMDVRALLARWGPCGS